ncbi:tetratricopeptide repeat protein [Mucilaginibacter paludis]|nr:tetratricopeptide repeat protein [Mucilaginibacter paludis]
MSLDFGEWERIVQIGTRCVSVDPKDIESYFFRSLAFYQLGQKASAVNDANTVLHLMKWKDVYLVQGEFYEKFKKDTVALICYEIGYAVFKSVDYLVKIARLKNQSGDYAGALKSCELLLGSDPQAFRGYVNRSKALWGLARHKEAIADLFTCIRMNPYYADSYANLAAYSFSKNELREEAICLLRMALKQEPNNSGFCFALGDHYANWKKLTPLSQKFITDVTVDDTLKAFVDDRAFADRDQIARGYYAHSFASLFQTIQTEMDTMGDHIQVSMFIGNANHLFDLLKNNSIYFSEVNSFPDKVSDCPLLNPANQSHLAVNISYNNVRVRCCSSLNKPQEIASSVAMWDRYANGHRGLCYTLEIPKTWLLKNNIYAGKITYLEEPPPLRADTPEQVIKDGLFVKHHGYQDEREFRLVHFGKFPHNDGVKFHFHSGKAEDDAIKIKAIYLGSHMSHDHKQLLADILFDYPDRIDTFGMSVAKNGQLEFSTF